MLSSTPAWRNSIERALAIHQKAFCQFQSKRPKEHHTGKPGGELRPLWVKSRHVQCKPPCPLHPRKRTRALQLAMSAKGQKRTFVATKLPATAILAHLVDEA